MTQKICISGHPRTSLALAIQDPLHATDRLMFEIIQGNS